MPQKPENVISIVLATVTLHNLIRRRYRQDHHGLADEDDPDHQVVQGGWRNGDALTEMDNIQGGNSATRAGKKERLYLKSFYNSEAGAVPWQDNMI